MNRCLLLLSLCLGLASCGPSAITRGDVERMRQEVETAKKETFAADKSLAPMDSYVAQLQKGGVDDGYYLMVSPSDIARLASEAFLPYQFPAKSIYEKMSGSFTTTQVVGIEVLPGNKLKMRLKVIGKKIKIKENNSFVKPHLPKVKAGLEKGVMLDLKITMNLNPKTGEIVSRVHCTNVQLLKNNKDDYRSYLKKAINSKLQPKKYRLPLGKKGALAPAALMTTKHHVIVRYQ
jgi:hypothetical protein